MNHNYTHEKELTFFKNYIANLHLPYHEFSTSEPISSLADLSLTDMSLRQTLGISQNVETEWKEHLSYITKPNTIIYITDEFFCQYVLFQLPEVTESYISIGPYITSAITIDQLLEILEQKNVPSLWLGILKNYYRKITCLSNEDGLVAALNTLGDYLWGAENYTSESFIQGLPTTLDPLGIPSDVQTRADVFSNIEAVEEVYRAENEILQAVSRGRSAKAKQLLSSFPVFALEQRTEALRNLQNYTIVLNTLLRKAAEEGGVHPLYIDQLSSTFAKRIETFTRADSFMEFWNEMVQKYCTLVNKHSIKKYSLPIQKAMTRIDFDLAADLSLKSTADYLNINASYLSNLFKKETGYTFTDYVNMKRMEHAAYLLANTNTPVSTIAQTCGILDDNYFTKLFKKYYHKTPSKFRQDYFMMRKN